MRFRLGVRRLATSRCLGSDQIGQTGLVLGGRRERGREVATANDHRRRAPRYGTTIKAYGVVEEPNPTAGAGSVSG